MKVIHSADWHIGNFKGPEKDGVNLRSMDTVHCLETLAERAEQEQPELVLVSGDIFHQAEVWQGRSHKEVLLAREIILRLSKCSDRVVVMRGTPNHDSAEAFEELRAHFEFVPNVEIVTSPQVIQTEYADIAVLPGFEYGVYRAKHPGLGKEEENEVFSRELGNIVMGMRGQCRPDRLSILMAHYTVPGCNTESGQSQILTQFEPIVPAEALTAAAYDLVALGHIHRPQVVSGFENVFYSGSINANNFNDEGQERGFWIHYAEQGAFGQPGAVFTDSEFVKTPYREFITFRWTDTDITAINQGHAEEVAMNYWRWNGAVMDKIVRIIYECSAEKHKALNTAAVEKMLYDDGAFWVAGITHDNLGGSADRTNLSHETDPESNLAMYLKENGTEQTDIERIILKARPIIAKAMAVEKSAAFTGAFVPIEIEVKNYRAYEEERFNFADIQFCTINGQNGAGKSSLFMDAIIDCIYEQPREGAVKDGNNKPYWLRNSEGVRSGYISFTFSIGEKCYRITRTRAKSGKITLNLAELTNGEWEDRSSEKANDTQEVIEKLIGIDSTTFKSCALIMQDQYDIFLQAKKEDRMVILGNLLGLGIYGIMEDIARSEEAARNRTIAAKKQSMKVQEENILSAGNPMEEMEKAEKDLQSIEAQLREKNLEKENTSISLASKIAAKERHKKLLEGISTLNSRKRAAEENRETERHVIESCDTILANEETILSNANRYRKLSVREKELFEGATLYNQTSELGEVNIEIQNVENEKSGHQAELEELHSKLEKLSDNRDEDMIRRNAAEYDRKKQLLDAAYERERSFLALEHKISNAGNERNAVEGKYATARSKLESSELEQRKKSELLDNVECIDIESAKCAFLADAIAAKNILPGYAAKYAELEQSMQEEIKPIDDRIAKYQEEIKLLGYDAKEVSDIMDDCIRLKPYIDMRDELNQKGYQISLIQATIENTESNISKEEERLLLLKSKAHRLTQERERYKECYLEHESVLEEMQELKQWLEKENQLPVFKERRANAVRRVNELSLQISELEMETAEKQEEAIKELDKSGGIEALENYMGTIQMDIDILSGKSKQLQIRIGSLKEKIEEIKRIHEHIGILRKEVKELAEEYADYEQLKISFSQDGIPHQIIRTVLPKLSAVANNILGQMTGGQLSVDFKTEKFVRNGKKEKATLDIFIDENGKASLPYLSKSGGEKVKASLSVVLALAEIKASTAGIQFGMLFLDEPPFLDQEGISAYCDALETIRERYPDIKVMAITHDISMKGRFPQSIDVVKTDNGSKVIY